MNVANALAAAAAAWASGAHLHDIRQGLRTFTTSFFQAPGRLNLVEVAGTRVVIDYCHNVDGMRQLSDFVNRMMVDPQTRSGPARPRRSSAPGGRSASSASPATAATRTSASTVRSPAARSTRSSSARTRTSAAAAPARRRRTWWRASRPLAREGKARTIKVDKVLDEPSAVEGRAPARAAGRPRRRVRGRCGGRLPRGDGARVAEPGWRQRIRRPGRARGARGLTARPGRAQAAVSTASTDSARWRRRHSSVANRRTAR